MKIKESFPPNYADIQKAFPEIDAYSSAVFTFGNCLHNPHKTELREDLLVHEQVHQRQQTGKWWQFGAAKQWWERYLQDSDFRLDQEVKAYAEQYRYARKKLPAKRHKEFLHYLALDLSGAGYGSMIEYGKAESLIRQAEHELA